MTNENLDSVSRVRLPEALRTQADMIASIEGTDLSTLLREGLTLAIEKRRNDPAFVARLDEINRFAAEFIHPEFL